MSLLRFEGLIQNPIPRALVAALQEPMLTGTLLYVLTRGPLHLRERLLALFRKNLLLQKAALHISTLTSVLKVLVAWSAVKRINQTLNRFALNGWAFTQQGAAWEFGPAKRELVVVTGGSSGFGYEMVKAFSRVAKVVALDINSLPEELAVLPHVFFYQIDLSDYKSVEDVCERVRQEHGDPSVLINNAGIANNAYILDVPCRDTERLFQVNLISYFWLIREFMPGMLRQQKGHVVTIASMMSFVAGANAVDYSCSKIGTLYLHEGLRQECLTRYPSGGTIRTTSVHPGWHRTGIVKVSEKKLEALGVVFDPPSAVSDRVLQQVLSGRSGRLVVPEQAGMWVGFRSWPQWMQDWVSGLAGKRLWE